MVRVAVGHASEVRDGCRRTEPNEHHAYSGRASNGRLPGEPSPMVSVAMITYNHEKFIAQAVDSVLMQETVFGVELVIGEDCSADSTRAIVEGYERRFPDRIRLFVSEKNVGAQRNAARVFAACRGKYVACLEGDDYWTDPHKLQRQVDFLEANPDFVMCCHDVEMTFEGEVDRNNPYCRDFPQISTFDVIWTKHFIPTPSLVYRNHTIEPLPEWYFRTHAGDRALEMMLAHHGKCFYMPEKMAVRHRHPGGIMQTEVFKNKLRNLEHELILRKGVMDYTGRRGAILNDTIGRLHRRISVEYARRHDATRSIFHLLAALFSSGEARRSVLLGWAARRVKSRARRRPNGIF